MPATRPRLLHRQKVLLNLVQAAGGEVGSLDFQRLLFLFCEGQDAPPYEFVPYHYGAFSFTCYADRRKLIKRGWLEDAERSWRLAPDAVIEDHRSSELSALVQRVTARGDTLVARTYRDFPYFASRSKIAERVLSGDDAALKRIAASAPKPASPGLVTIGYEGRSLEAYLNILLRAGVTVLCDVRRNPLSRRYGFSKGALKGACEKLGIEYAHLPALGIASADRRAAAANDDFAGLFREYTKTTLPVQTERLDEIRAWVERGETVALTCYELEAEQCHRHCVASALEGMVPTHL